MIETGKSIHEVAKLVALLLLPLDACLLRSKADDSLQNKRGRGRKTSVAMVPKVVIPKLTEK